MLPERMCAPGSSVTGRSRGPALGYAPLDASGTGGGGSGRGPSGCPGRRAVCCSRPTELRRTRGGLGPRGEGTLLFDSPQHASHSMDHAYSFALEYARSACCGDCTSTMLSRRGVTFRDPEEALGDVSAGSDGVSGAGASGSAGGRAGSRGSGAGPQMGTVATDRVRDGGRRAARGDPDPADLRARHQRGGPHGLSGRAADAVRIGEPGRFGGDGAGRGDRHQLPSAPAASRGGRGHERPWSGAGGRPG